MSIVTVVASVVTVGLTIAGSVEAFDAAAQTSLASMLQASLGCYEPLCFLELRVAASSIQVDALLTIPDLMEGSSTATTRIATAATTLAATDSSTLSSALGVTVTATIPPTLQQAVSVPIVVAPPPPSPPPSPLPTTPPSPLPSSPPPLPSPPPPLTPPSRGGDAAIAIIIAVSGAGGALVALLYVCVCRRRKDRLPKPNAASGSCLTRVSL